jgi:ATP-dependent Clp protease ATP-binding subunit ClpX
MAQNTEDLSCSFCSKNKDEVGRLIAGPGVYICDECIESCYSLIQEQSAKDKKEQHQDWNYTPKQLFNFLNEYVIGQSLKKSSFCCSL